MADYQEYRRRILHRRWRRVFIIVALLALLALLGAIGILWKVLHRERVDTALSQNTILRQVTTDNTWNTVSYPLNQIKMNNAGQSADCPALRFL
jgi:spore maturation protein SpmB